MILTPVETGQNYLILQKKTKIEYNTSKSLSVQVSLFGLSFLVQNASGTVSFYKEIKTETPNTPEELEALLIKEIELNSVLNETFSKVTLVYHTEMTTVVPTPLFDSTQPSEYLKFNTKILATDFIAYDEIKSKEITVVFVPYMNINNYFFDTYGAFTYLHANTVLLENLLLNNNSANKQQVTLYIQKGLFTMCYVNNSKLVYSNSYTYNTPQDLVYYTMFTLEQLKLDPNSIDVHLCGEINSEDEIYTLLYTYIRNIIIESSSINYNDKEYDAYLLKSIS